LLVISSCANITEGPEGTSFSLGTKEPSSERELRLLSVDVAQGGNLSANVEYWATINFEADPKPEIRRACFNFSGDGQTCVDVQAKDVTYGSHAYFRVPIHVPVGSKRIDCYAEYIRDGKTRRTNTVTYYVIVLKKPEE
jgi:catechol 2,3-dioxygenase-like lactoylglutathione lyase family enzyme